MFENQYMPLSPSDDEWKWGYCDAMGGKPMRDNPSDAYHEGFKHYQERQAERARQLAASENRSENHDGA